MRKLFKPNRTILEIHSHTQSAIGVITVSTQINFDLISKLKYWPLVTVPKHDLENEIMWFVRSGMLKVGAPLLSVKFLKMTKYPHSQSDENYSPRIISDDEDKIDNRGYKAHYTIGSIFNFDLSSDHLDFIKSFSPRNKLDLSRGITYLRDELKHKKSA